MQETTVATVVKMLDTLPPELQERTVEHLREYIQDLLDEQRWEQAFAETQAALQAKGKQVKEAIAAGQSEPLDWERL